MMESKAEKRVSDDLGGKILEPILIKIDKHGCTPRDIHIDKCEFKIGRARDNDEIILDTMISRKHCVLRCEGDSEWTIKDISSNNYTFINDVAIARGIAQKITVGDVIQFSNSTEFKYVFTLALNEEREIKRPKMEEQILDNVLIEQKTFAESQECQRKELKDKLQTKKKEQIELKQQLEELLRQQSVAKEDKEGLQRQIVMLEKRIETGNTQEQILQDMYAQLLDKLENERIQFEERLNTEKQKWQEALDMSKQEKEELERKMQEQMEKWRKQQQEEWKKMMENKMKEERNIQKQLLNEKTQLEEKLKQTEQALKDQTAKAETLQTIQDSEGNPGQSCIFVEIVDVNDTTVLPILDTIDLTECSQSALGVPTKEGVFNKVGNIMDEQLTCSVCSELFVNATTLNCMHTFCQHCINSWSKRKKECPVCRAPVKSMNRSLVLDNFIESMMENLPTQFKDRRKEIVQERLALEKKKKKIH